MFESGGPIRTDTDHSGPAFRTILSLHAPPVRVFSLPVPMDSLVCAYSCDSYVQKRSSSCTFIGLRFLLLMISLLFILTEQLYAFRNRIALLVYRKSISLSSSIGLCVLILYIAAARNIISIRIEAPRANALRSNTNDFWGNIRVDRVAIERVGLDRAANLDAAWLPGW